jgi:chromosomal replication initiation ATPase DnaA
MARIEIDITEYQGMKSKIRDLENALNSVSQEAATNKETIEQAKALVVDLENEPFLIRLFHWKSVIEPFKDLFKLDGKIQETQ